MEDTIDNNICKSFTIYSKHLDFLESVNKNTSYALRNVIDKAIINHNNKKKSQLMKDISLYIVICGLGVVFFLFGLRSISIFEMLISYALGFFMMFFGVIGGMLIALQSTSRK